MENRLRQSLATARDQARQEGEGEGRLVALANSLIDLWLFQDNPDLYDQLRRAADAGAIRRSFVSRQVVQGGPLESELRESNERVGSAKQELLLRFHDILFFLSANNILTVQARDIYTSRPLPIAPQEELVPRPFDLQRAGQLYVKYGGTLLGGAEPEGSEPFRSTQFRAVFREITEKAGEDPELRRRLERPIRSGPFIQEMKIYREWLAPQLEEIIEDLERLEAQLEQSRTRLAHLRSGKARFEDVEQPYRHRRQWVDMPEHSGVVRVKPIVVSAIDSGFTLVKSLAS